MSSKKKARCFADGGIIGSDGMTDTQRAKRNAVLQNLGMSTAPVTQAAPPQVTQPVPQPVQQPESMIQRAAGILGGRREQIDKASGYANGGIVRGKGGVDNVPMSIGGVDVNLTGGKKPEAVLPGNTVEALGGPAAVESLIEATNGKPPVRDGLKEGGRYSGGSIYDPAYDELKKIPVQAFPNTVSAIQAGGDAAKAAADAGNYGAAVGQVGRGAISGIAGIGKDVMNSVAYALDPAANALKTLVTGDSTPARNVQSATPAPVQQQSINPGSEFQPGSQFGPEKERFPVGTKSEFITGNNGSMPDSSGGGFVSGNKAYNVNQTSQAGVSKVTAPGTSPLYTNIKPESAVTGLKDQMIGGDAASVNEGIARMANANKIRGEMIANRDKDIPAGGYGPGILGDGGIAADNAEKTQRWRSDELLRMTKGGKNGNQVAVSALMNADSHRDIATMGNETQRQNAGIAAQTATNRDQVTMRGQDLQAANEAMRISGNPLDNKIKALSLNQASGIADLQNRAIGGDAKALEILRSLNGKSGEHIRTNVVGGGTNELGQAQPQYLAVTGPDGKTQFVAPNGKQDGANVSAQNIRAEMQAGRISREDAIKQLKAMGYQ